MSVHGGNLRAASRHYGRDESAFLDFSANINPLGLPTPISDALHGTVDRLHAYPDPDCVALREAIARLDGVEADRVLCGNGASELIQIAFDALRPRRTLLLTPGFFDYERSARLCGSELQFLPLDPDRGWQVDPNALHDALDDLSPGDAVITGQPNNPTSTLWPRETLLELACACRDRGIYLLVDEAFLFLTLPGRTSSLIDELADLPQTLLLRAFTKSLALPGLRLGYAIAAPELLTRLKQRQITWSVNAFAQAIAPALGQLNDYFANTYAWLAAELDAQFAALSAIEGLTPFSPETNFVLARLDDGLRAGDLCNQTAKSGVLIRNASNFRGLDERYIRMAVKSRGENAALIAALRKAFAHFHTDTCEED